MHKNLNNIIINYNKNKKQYLETLKNEKNFINRIKKRIPNILTKSRILTPLIILPTVLTGNFLLSTIIISLLGITDFFDGFLARKWNATSEYGRKLDAISDKMYALGVLIPLISFNINSKKISIFRYIFVKTFHLINSFMYFYFFYVHSIYQ